MSEPTFWGLAQEWRKQATEPGDILQQLELTACAVQLENLLSETAAQWKQNAQDYGQRTKRENEIAWAVTEAHCADLGVPKEVK